jgi:cytochrome c
MSKITITFDAKQPSNTGGHQGTLVYTSDDPCQKGHFIFKKHCAMCHTTEIGQEHKIGPNLHGVFERHAGANKEFFYSDPLRNKGVHWNRETLDRFVENPARYMPGTKMVFHGLKDAEQRNWLITYLEKVTDSKTE